MTTSTEKRTPDKRRPDLDTVFSINADGSRNHIHPADVHGRWQVRKNIIYAVLIVIYIAMPWIELGGNPLVCFDIRGRVAYLFGGAFTNQDVYLLFFIVSGFGFALFVRVAHDMQTREGGFSFENAQQCVRDYLEG